MRVVWLSPFPPYPADFGGALRTYNLLKQAIRAGHEIHLICWGCGDGPRDQESVRVLSDLCASVQLVDKPAGQKRWQQLRALSSRRSFQYFYHYSPAIQQLLSDTIRRVKPNLVQVEFSQMAYYDLPAGLPKVLDLHNIEYEVLQRMAEKSGTRFRRMYNLLEYSKFKRDEPHLWQRFDSLLTTSKRDKEIVLEAQPDARILVVPNGVDTEYFHPADSSDGVQDDTVIFTGLMSYFPNIDGVQFFKREIWQHIEQILPSSRWIIMGLNPPPEVQAFAGESIEVTGGVDDVRPRIWQSAVCVVPLRMGGGTRLKVVEALAMGKAMVSTSLGCEGIDVKDGQHLLIRDDPQLFAGAVIRLLQDPQQRAALGQAGRRLAIEKYDWQVVARPMLDEWEWLAGK